MAREYGKAGVDVDIESKGARILYEAAKQTFENRKGILGEIIIPFDDFSGLRMVDVSKLPEGSFMCMGFDGVGTKVEIAHRMNKHDTIAFDLLAMVCDDAVVRGGEPVLVGSNLDVNTLGMDDSKLHIVKELAQGYMNAAKEANVAIINGELCQMGNSIKGHGNLVYHWNSALIWFARKEKIFTGKEIKEDDSIVVFEEKGFRSNGLSLVRKVFEDHFGENWHNEELNGKKLGEHVLVPSKIYSKAVVDMHGSFDKEGTCKIHGVAHITGGGILEKVGRMLRPSKLGVELTNLFPPCEAMQYCQKLGNIDDKEAYKTWNMGNGMAIITPEPEKVIEEAKKFNINAKIAGKVIKENKIIIDEMVFENE